jgi:cysteine synthase A
MSIEIVLNGKNEQLAAETSLVEFLENKQIRPEVVTIELNDKVIKKQAFADTSLKAGDRLELVFFMGGGDQPEPGVKSGARVAASVLDLIGNTPLVQLNRLVAKGGAAVYAKLEAYSPGGSVKDRIALNMIEAAEKRGTLKKGAVIVEPTSGNTGIGLALVCVVKGYKCILTMPESMSLERVFILKSFGAEIVLTPAEQGMAGAVKKAEQIKRKTARAFMPQQFKNPDNPAMHARTTAREIAEALPGTIDALVCGVGTGGTITGIGRELKKHNPRLLVVAVEPESSAVLSGKAPGPHKIQGIGAGFVPEVLDSSVVDRIVTVNDEDAYRTAGELTSREGIFCGISSGAAGRIALAVAVELGKGKKVVVVLPDTGERYFSMQQYFEG